MLKRNKDERRKKGEVKKKKLTLICGADDHMHYRVHTNYAQEKSASLALTSSFIYKYILPSTPSTPCCVQLWLYGQLDIGFIQD